MPWRLPDSYGTSRRLAMIPSRFVPTCLSHFLRIGNFCGYRGQPDRFVTPQIFTDEFFQQFSSVDERQLRKALAVIHGQQVEYDQERRWLGGETFHAALRRVNTLQQVVERKRLSSLHNDFTIKHDTFGLQRGDS